MHRRNPISSHFFILVALVVGCFFPLSARALTTEERTKLEADLAQIEKQIESQRSLVESKQREGVTLERDVAIFTAQIQKSKLQIKARELSIQKLSNDISSKRTKIGTLSTRIGREHDSLNELLRKTSEYDALTLPEVLFATGSLSEIFADVDSYESVTEGVSNSLTSIKEAKETTEVEKRDLESKRAEELELKGIQELERKRLEEQEKAKKKLLADTKGKEAEYQKILASQVENAQAIRNALFNLSGASAIPFEKAYEYAKVVEGKTGIRPALLLGIITVETNLGKNIGTGNWLVDMHPTRDRPVFEKITAKLGLNPDKMPVSKKAWYGWGGAMGPAQFIPSTWVLYEDRVSSLTGNNPPNPWHPQDAFMASGLLLADNGAKYNNAKSERLAALRYLAGWTNATKPSYAFYGDDVMEFAAKYQRQIDILQG